MNLLVPAFAGALFAVGLVFAGMTQPEKVVAFLDVSGDWNPSLAFVMIGAIATHTLAYRLVPRLGSPWLGGRFGIPTRSDVDARLLGGAVLFGLGWGIGGFCPGPALASLATGTSEVFIFVGAMLAGMSLFGVVEKTLLSPANTSAPAGSPSRPS